MRSGGRDGLLGNDICGHPGFEFDIEIHLGAGAYVCGEESALIESLEGRRGIPRNRPPYPVTHGYLQQPTTVNNVETFCAAALIALRGGEWYAGIGTAKSTGTKILSVSGDCARPGIYEYPFGVTVRQVLEDCGAATHPGGADQRPLGHLHRCRPSSSAVSPSRTCRPLGPSWCSTRSRDIFEVARNFTHFFAHESCGFCTPCRVGTTLLRNIIDKLHRGKGSQHELNQIFSSAGCCSLRAIAALATRPAIPLLDTIKRFRPAYERRLESLEFEPAFRS